MHRTKLQAILTRLKNLSQDTAKRLPSFLLSAAIATIAAFLLPASAQFSPIKKEGEIYYEYIDPVVSPYDHYLTLPNGEGHSFYKFKTLEAAQQNIRTAQERAITQIKARLDPTGLATCAFGPITVNDAPAANNYYGGKDSYESNIYILVKRYLSAPCEPSNYQYIGTPALVESYISWSYSCPHGYSYAETASNGAMMCRRPMVYEPPCCGNPVTHASEKIQYETDYRSADGLLELTRTYSSSRYPEPGWTTHFDTRVMFSRPITTVVRADGSRLFFEFNGTSFKSLQPTQAKLTMNAEGFIFTTREDVSEIYNTAGFLTAWLYRDGKKITLQRNSESATQHRLTVTDPYGRNLVLHYQILPNDGTLYLRYLTLPDGVEFEFKSNTLTGMFEQVTREGYLRKYDYDDYDARKLTGITDENAVRYAEFSYRDFPGTGTKYLGDVNSYFVIDRRSMTGAGNVNVSEPLGSTASYNYATVNGVSRMMSMTREGQGTRTLSYDSNGNTASRTDFNGNLTRYTYNLARNLEISRTEGLSADGIGTPDTRTIETTWHPVFRLPTKILVKTPAGVVLQQTTMSYDKFGHMSTETAKDIVLNQARTTTYKYVYSTTLPWHVEKLTVVGPRADVPDTVTIDYWAADAVCAGTGTGSGSGSGSGSGQDKGCRGKVKSITNALGQITHYEAYDAHGRPTAIRNHAGLLTTINYTSRGWLTAMTVDGETTNYEYDGVGLVKTATISNGTALSYQYDDAHRLTGISDSLGNSISYVLDSMGNRLNEISKDPEGNIKQQLARIINKLNRITQVMEATTANTTPTQEITTTYEYDAQGNRISITDPLRHRTSTNYDALNRPNRTTDPKSGTTQTSYDALDQIRQITDPRNLVTSYGINNLGDQLSLRSPDTGNRSAKYDAGGNLIQQIDARGVTEKRKYDALNRVTRVEWVGPSKSGTPVVPSQYIYDQGVNGTGHLTGIIDESGHTEFSYDLRGRMLGKVQTVAAGSVQKTFSMSQTFGKSGSATGSITSLTYPSGNRIEYTYDAVGRVQSVRLQSNNESNNQSNNQSTTLMSDISYNHFTDVNGWTWGNGSKWYRQYDLNGRVTGYPLGDTVAGGLERTVVYDAASRIRAMTHTGDGSGPQAPTLFDQRFEYDNLNRLTQFTVNNFSQTYLYDPNGNRTQVQQGAAGYANDIDPASNRLQRAAGPEGTRNFTYDAEGNVKTDGTLSFEFALHGRMRSINSTAGKTTYWYNALGQRVRKTGQDTTYYFYDGEGRVLGEYDRNGSAIQETVYLDNMPVVVLKQEQRNTVPYYIYADHINTPRVITRASDNAMVWRWDSADPFGAAAPDENPAGMAAFVYNPRFPGQMFDRESGFHYNYFRDYDPKTGRYLTSDPIGLNGGINTYAYVNGNPVNNIDPGGLQTWPGDAGPSSPRPTIPGPFDIFHPGTQVNNTFVQSVNQIIDKVKDFCLPDELSCSPPEGTKCYVGPDTSHGHGGLSSHYHIFQMFKFSGRCQWKYLGGKVGKGVLEIPPIGMAACSNYPGFQGR